MNLFEESTRLKLRFKSTRGYLSVEDLWDLSLSALKNVAKPLKAIITKEGEINDDFDLGTSQTEQVKEAKLKYEVILHIFKTKRAEQIASQTSLDNKAKKAKLLAILAEKQDKNLREMSEEDLLAKIKELN